MATHLIYALSDPHTGEVRYIGQSSRGLSRPRQHWNQWYLKTERTHKANWVRSLISLGVEPVVEIVEEVPGEDLDAAEVFWITQFRALGFDLTNATDGGDGRRGPCTEEHKRRVGDANRGRRRTSAMRSRMAAAHRGLPSPNRGRVWPEEYKLKMARACGSRPFVDENGNLYQTLREASNFLNVLPSSVSNVLKGRSHTAGGHSFKYTE